MRSQFGHALLGLGITAISTVTAYDILQDGPFALHVKGQAENSSVDGYLHFVDLPDTFPMVPLQYEPMSTPPVGNETYEFYLNYTAYMVTDEQVRGWLVTDLTHINRDPRAGFGKAMSLHFTADSNVGFGLLGAGFASFLGFDSSNNISLSIDFTDAAFVPNVEPTIPEEPINVYNWAVCWQYVNNRYIPALSWITHGPSHNPTCERVDLIREAF
ncbi:hypothetical protein F5B22DRAFT_588436 [Xylaria bambusicola]|uniref:uncharacterized protein n=1 Tax=Xylaria bambusicola TaxID=326684 RepID=UPI002007B79A|nr:uncharacterized protein F5B22DRAFT_588436 [Xylaria bambusicola]KAI0525947.1 hypothetical protein F5B22DRAFT_588436 [Xylaria bambusicola]